MPVAIEIPQEAVALPHKLWTREECEQLERIGMVDVNRYELIEGELIHKMSKNSPHMLSVVLLYGWLQDVFGRLFVVPEPTIDVRPEDNPTSAPEPDAIVLTRSLRGMVGRPRPQEIRLLAEVSSTTLPFDLATKSKLYARSGIVEYWVLDLDGGRLIVHRDPGGGIYRSVQAYGENEFVTCLAAPDHEVRVGELLR